MAKHGKKYRAAVEKIERERAYSPLVGFTLLKDIDFSGYDTTVECVIRLDVDPRKADQMVRGAVSLPHGIGKTARVAVVASGEAASAAREAGAEHVGDDELIELIAEGSLLSEIDVIIATPDMMGKLGRLGKALGPRGLMPNPKSGTVTTDVAKAVVDIKAGRVEYRTDRNGNVHAVLGKVSFSRDQLIENYGAFLEEILRQRPSSAKGRYVQNVAISTSTSPGIALDGTKTRDLLETEA